MHSRIDVCYLMVSLWVLRYHTTPGAYCIGFPTHQYQYWDSHWWDSHFRSGTSWPVWIRFDVSSRRWQSWWSLPLRALKPPRLVQGLIQVLDTCEVVLSVSPTCVGSHNSISGVDTTPVLNRQCWERRCVPKSPTLEGYSPIKWTVATPLQLSQSPNCKSLQQQPRWKSFQAPFYPPPVLLAYEHPKPTSSRWTIWPKPGEPDT